MATIIGNNRNNILSGTNSSDTILGRDGNDVIDGRSGNDRISGGRGNDQILGGTGNDRIDGGSGNDQILGGTGNDRIDSGSGNDQILGGDGNDIVDGGSGNDFVDGGSGNDVIDGGSGNDQILGGDGNDIVDGGSGNDFVDGGSGNDVIDGGSGNDQILGGDGNDTVDGGSGNDWIDGGSGNDLLSGGSGNDIIDGGSGNDFVDGGSGNDWIDGGSGNDLLFGGSGNDIVDGGSGDDFVDGGSGNDVVGGGTGNDLLFGGAGDDALIGGAGADQLTGGSGSDRFVYLDASDSPAASGWDRITDFNQGRDKIDFAAFRNLPSDLDLIWKGEDPAVPGPWGVWYHNDPTSTFVFADTSGDGIADVKIELRFTPGLNLLVTDFIGVSDAPVTDINDAPVINSNGGGDTAAVSVAENTTAVTAVTASDPDALDTRIFSISGGADAALFSINSATGALSFVSAPNFEAPIDVGANNVYNVTVRVADSGGLFDTQAIAVTVTDTNDVAPAITSGATGSEAENALTSNVVYDANATDPDTVGTVAFSLTGTDAGLFSINSATGEVTFLASPDFEAPADADANNLYEVVVHANDGVQDTTQAVTIAVTDTNDVAPAITSGATGSEAENAPTSNVVYDANATDPDTVGTVAFSLTGTDAGLFSINSATGEVTFLASPDFEAPADADANNLYEVVVHANDGVQDTTQAVTIAVTDTNDVAPAITSGATGSEAENAPTSNVVYDANATDPDTVGTVAFSLTGTDAGLFSINSATGEVTFLASPDFEAPADADANNLYEVVVHANDGVQDTTQAVTIAVTDTNDAPVITSHGGGSTAVVTVTENTTMVNTATASDPDALDTLIFSISGGADATSFSIDSSTGMLSFVSAPNFEAPTDADGNNVYNVTVKVSDSGGLFDTQEIAVVVTENHPPVAVADNVITNVSRNQPVNIPEWALLANDSDPNLDPIDVLDVSATGGGTATHTLGTGTDGYVTFIPNNSDEGGAFDYRAVDVWGAASSLSGVNVTLDRDGDLDGTLDNDILVVGLNSGAKRVVGIDGNDILVGGRGNDTLSGGVGDDTIDGGAGTDLLDFSEVSTSFSFTLGADGSGSATVNGTDTYRNMEGVIGGSGNDSLTGNAGDNILQGGAGNDTLTGGEGVDLLDYSNNTTGFTFTLAEGGNGIATVDGTDTYQNMEGIVGGSGDDSLTGNTGDNILQSGAGSDVLTGGDGNDILTGGDGSDILTGGNGSDLLAGGNDSDILTGGDGSDVFDYNSFADAGDTITDFSEAEGDKLDLHDLLTSIGAPDHMSAFDDGYLKLTQAGDDTLVQIGDGSGSDDSFQTLATLSGVTLTSIDAFIL